MTCLLVDDHLTSNGKIQEAVESFGGGVILALWLAVGTACAGPNTEGVVAPAAARSAGRFLIMEPADVERAVGVLIETRLWHDERTVRKCAACLEHLKDNEIPKLPKGGYLFHDWGRQQFNRQVAKDPRAREQNTKKKQLHRMPEVVRAVRRRDGDVCRYCGEEVNFNARNGPRMGTYDHKDPNGPNDERNVVVACKQCNGEKKDRTPSEWVSAGGRELLPVPNRTVEISDPISNPVRNASRTDANRGSTLAGAHAGDGTGQNGSGLALAGVGPVGSGPGTATNEGPEAA